MTLQTVSVMLDGLSLQAKEANKNLYNITDDEKYEEANYVFGRVQQELLALAAGMAAHGLTRSKKI